MYCLPYILYGCVSKNINLTSLYIHLHINNMVSESGSNTPGRNGTISNKRTTGFDQTSSQFLKGDLLFWIVFASKRSRFKFNLIYGSFPKLSHSVLHLTDNVLSSFVCGPTTSKSCPATASYSRITNRACISHYRVSREANLKLLQANLPAFATALGSAMPILGNAVCGVDLVPAEDKIAKVVKRKQKHVFIAAGIILLSMLVSRYLLTSTAQYFLETTQEANAKMEPLQKGTAATATYEDSRNEFGMLFEQMKGSVELRGRVLSALQALDSVLVTFPNSKSPSLTVAAKDGAPSLGEQMEEILSNRLWVPWARFSRLDDPSARDSKKGSDAPTEPTYEFKVRVMVKSKDSSEQSVAFIKEKFQTPLEAALKTQGLDIKPAKDGGPLVQIGTIQPNLTEIYFSPSGRDAGTDEGQDGRPFDSVEVSWVLVTRPLETEEDPEEGDEADEETPEEG